MRAALEEAAKYIANSATTIALSGAGISVDSGIPDFRSSGGLWERFDPMDYAHIQSFLQDPMRVWGMLAEMRDLVTNSKPNPGHIALAKLQELGRMQAIITQNIDNLHQKAGNNEVIEFHGNSQHLTCLVCGTKYDEKNQPENNPPTCTCGNILKPDIVFFGETIPPEAYQRSVIFAEMADVMLVVGTSAQVAPANMLPSITRNQNGIIIEVNLEKTHLSRDYGAIFLEGNTSEVLPELANKVEILLNK